MGRIIVIAGVTLLVLLAGVMIVPQLIPSSVYRERIQTAASQALGRPVVVDGKVRVSVFPRIEARAGGASIANPDGFGEAPFASMKELRGAVKLWPLLFQRVEIDEFVLVEPTIGLIQLENGRNNWTFEPPKPAEPRPDQPPPKAFAGSLGDVRIVDGLVTYDDRKAGQTRTFSDLDLKASMQAMTKPLQVEATGVADDLPFKLDARVENPQDMLNGVATAVKVELATDLLNTDLDGKLALGPTPAYDFAFKGDVPSVTQLADAFKVADLPAREVLGRVAASGRVEGTPSNIGFTITDARHESALLNADFNGAMRIAEFITFDLALNAEAPRLADLASAMKIDAPAAGALGKATASTKVGGKLGDLQFTDVKFRHDGGLLDMSFDGAARLSATLTHAGRVSIAAPDLRKLADAAGTKLPPGNIYRSFSLTGDTSGDTRSLLMKNAVLAFDNVQGTGEAALAFGARPKLVGALNTNVIDITPYASASGAPDDKKSTGGWGSEPLDLSPLRMADADLTLKADGIRFQKFDFGPSNLGVTLAAGKLTADLKQTTLFGGAGGATVVADGSGAIPAVAVKANLKGLGLKPFLGAAAGFDMVEGNGDLNVDITGQGATMQALMSSLGGNGAFNFGNGMIRGVDLPELVQTAQNALRTRSIPLSAFGSDESTAFRDLKASFSMKDGVAAMADLKLENNVMTVSGGGSLDIGRQTLSLSMFPEFKDRNAGVKGYGLPVKLSGGWDGVNIAFDFDWLVQRATADVRARVSTEIEDELRKQLGPNFSSILGGRGATPAAQPAQPAQPAETQTQTPTEPEAQPEPTPEPAPRQTIEERARDGLGRAIGGLLRPN